MVKVLFVGSARSGKTTALNRLLGRGNHGPYKPTNGAEITSFVNKNGVYIDVWDCGGAKGHTGLADGYYVGADICVLFGDNKADLARDVMRVTDDVVVYPFHNIVELRRFMDAIAEESKSPVGYVTDEEVTIINVFV
jgi:GTPase SAR1 family protein